MATLRDWRAREASSPPMALVGDLGGTNLRLGLVDLADPSRIQHAESFECRWFGSAAEVVAAYLKKVGEKRPLGHAVIACAGPVTDGAVSLTNISWSVTEADLKAFGFSTARLINDYMALALVAPLLDIAEAPCVGGPPPSSERQTIAVVGAGTGFGVSALARDEFCDAVLATEGGHVAFAPTDDVEIDILQRMGGRFGRVSVERLLSGPGLCSLHEVLSEIDGSPIRAHDPKAITAAALKGHPACAATLDRFCGIFGSVAGDVALTLGARGGVFLGGGIAPAVLDFLKTSSFRPRFESKGRFRGYMQAIPTRVIVKEHAALVGALEALRQMLAKGTAEAASQQG